MDYPVEVGGMLGQKKLLTAGKPSWTKRKLIRFQIELFDLAVRGASHIVFFLEKTHTSTTL